MLFQFRNGWMPLTVVAGAIAALSAVRPAPVAAQTTQKLPAESLIYDLKNPDAGRRRSAVHQLGVAKYVPATLDIAALVHDPDASVRREVELSLEQMNDISALPGFVQLTADEEKDIRSRAIDALIDLHMSHDKGASAMLTKLQNFLNHKLDDDADVVIEPDVPVDPSVIKALSDRLTDREVSIRRQAARGLGVLRGDAGIPGLLVALREDRDDEVRFESARSLRKIGNPSVGDPLITMLDLNNDRVRNEVITTLGGLRFRRAVPDLTKVFEMSKPGERSRTLSMAALADIAEPSSAALFEQFKADKDENIRLYANEGLSRIANPATKTPMSSARLTEKSSRVQAAQAFGLMKMGQTEFLEELVRALGSSSTRDLAKEYLQETPVQQRAALFAARPKDASARAQLAEIYGLMGDRAAMPALQDLAHDSDPGVAKAAERGIKWMNAYRND
jgi:HEAT repeat protein